MRTLSKSLLGIFLLTFTVISWAACPEGYKSNYKGECVPIVGQGKESTAPDKVWNQLPIGRDLANPGDVLIDFETTTPGFSCNRPSQSLPEPLNKMPDMVGYQTKTDKEYEAERQKEEQIYRMRSALIRAGTRCLYGSKNGALSDCQNIIDWVERVVEKDAFKPLGFKKWPMSVKEIPRREDGWSAIPFMFMYLLGFDVTNAYAVATKAMPTSSQSKAAFIEWMERRVDLYFAFFRQHGWAEGRAANGYIAVANARLALYAFAGNAEKFWPALSQWQTTLASIRSDGSLPMETRRGTRALYYEARALQGLIKMAKMAEVQGIDLYKLPIDGEKSFQKAMAFYLTALGNHDLIIGYAKENEGGGYANDPIWGNYEEQHLSSLIKQETGFLDYLTVRLADTDLDFDPQNIKLDDRTCSNHPKKRPAVCKKNEKGLTLADLQSRTRVSTLGWMGDLCFYPVESKESSETKSTVSTSKPAAFCYNKATNRAARANLGQCEVGYVGITLEAYTKWKKENTSATSKTKEKKTHCYYSDTNTLKKSRYCPGKLVTLEEGEALVKQGN